MRWIQKILVLKMASELQRILFEKIPAHPQATLASCCVLTLPWPYYFQNVSEYIVVHHQDLPV